MKMFNHLFRQMTAFGVIAVLLFASTIGFADSPFFTPQLSASVSSEANGVSSFIRDLGAFERLAASLKQKRTVKADELNRLKSSADDLKRRAADFQRNVQSFS